MGKVLDLEDFIGAAHTLRAQAASRGRRDLVAVADGALALVRQERRGVWQGLAWRQGPPGAA